MWNISYKIGKYFLCVSHFNINPCNSLFFGRDPLRSNLGIICGPGIICGLVQHCAL